MSLFFEKLAAAALKGALKESEKVVNKWYDELQTVIKPVPEHIEVEVVTAMKEKSK